jgi:ubiquinol-cytochrome c reductase cytochrome b subunit
VPIISRIETPRPLPNSITEAVLGNEGGSRITATAATA